MAWLYAPLAGGCLYCGDATGGGYDHVPPRAMAAEGWLVPCCQPCDSRLGTRRGGDLLGRIEFMNERYKKEWFNQWHDVPEWEEDEIVDLKPKMRRYIRLQMELKKQARARHAWSAERILSRIGPTSDFARYVARLRAIPGSGPVCSQPTG